MAKKVALVCSSTVWGGTEKWTLRTCEELIRQGLEVTLIVRKPELWLSRSKVDLNLVELPFRNDYDLGTMFRLRSIFGRNAEIVIPTRVRDYFLAGMAAKLSGTKVLLRLGIVRRLRDNYLMDRLRYGFFPHAILVNAEAIKEELYKTSWMQNKKVYMIRNGVESPGSKRDFSSDKIRDNFNIKEDEIFLLGVGRLAHEKRFDWLIKTVNYLNNNKIKAKGCILGEGSRRTELESEIEKLGLKETVFLPGTQLDVSDWYNAADMILLPSNNEGLSNVMLEAMGHAKPVLATISGGVLEVFEDRKELMLVDTDDMENFHERSLELCTNEELRIQIGANAHKRVLGDFNWPTMAKHLQEVFHELETR